MLEELVKEKSKKQEEIVVLTNSLLEKETLQKEVESKNAEITELTQANEELKKVITELELAEKEVEVEKEDSDKDDEDS